MEKSISWDLWRMLTAWPAGSCDMHEPVPLREQNTILAMDFFHSALAYFHVVVYVDIMASNLV